MAGRNKKRRTFARSALLGRTGARSPSDRIDGTASVEEMTRLLVNVRVCP